MSHKPLKNVMVYKEKTDPNIDGVPQLSKMKCREAYPGQRGQQGLDIVTGEAPTLDQVTARIILFIARALGLPTAKFDCPLAFLNSILFGAQAMLAYPGDSKNKYNDYTEEFIYTDADGQPYLRWYRTAVYGGKSSSALWFQLLHTFLVDTLGFADSEIATGLGFC